MKKHLMIFTEGGRKFGFGHITRCLSISTAFEKAGISVEFIINGDNSIKGLLGRKGFVLTDWVKKGYGITGNNIVIVDSYLARPAFYNAVSQEAGTAVFIDDNRRLNYPTGIVVNGNIYAKNLNYPVNPNVRYLLGVEYMPLREPFWETVQKKIDKEVASVMITFGGADPLGATPFVLSVLKIFFPQLKKKIIIGKGFRQTSKIKLACDKNTELIYHPGAVLMKKIMMESDLAISNGGQTLYELARVGVTTLAICIVDNQVRNVKAWKKTGFLECAFWGNNKALAGKIKKFICKYSSIEERWEKSEIGRSLVDGKGALKIAKEVLRYG